MPGQARSRTCLWKWHLHSHQCLNSSISRTFLPSIQEKAADKYHCTFQLHMYNDKCSFFLRGKRGKKKKTNQVVGRQVFALQRIRSEKFWPLEGGFHPRAQWVLVQPGAAARGGQGKWWVGTGGTPNVALIARAPPELQAERYLNK